MERQVVLFQLDFDMFRAKISTVLSRLALVVLLLAGQSLYAMEFKARAEHFNPLEILRQATSGAAELLEQSGKRHPYRDGKLGAIEAGAYADLLLVDGDPLADITLFSEPEKNLRLIMKNGVVYKNTLSR